MARRVVVIGGDAAGMSAASQALRTAGPDALEVVAFEAAITCPTRPAACRTWWPATSTLRTP